MLFEGQGDLLITCSVRELLDKVVEVLDRYGFVQSRDDMVVTLADTRLVEFLETVRDSRPFNASEAADISVLQLASGEVLSFQSFNRARTLDLWLELLDARDLVEVVARKSFLSWFQPILSATDGSVVGHESLLRARRPDGGLMFPGEIFSKALTSDLLFQVDRLARVSALRCAAHVGVEGLLFINFVPTAIYDPAHCLQTTVRWANRLGFEPHQIVFEVVETEKVEDIDHLKRILDFYREVGYRVALDDVGSGYASLNLLALLKPDIIKVDMGIMRHIHLDRERQAIFKALVGIARELGIQVLAEGLESEGELAYAVEHGADLVQGYLFARPAPDLSVPDGIGYWNDRA
ncbi:EAL domain-containing protein [Imhoffiella purpurea]|uniref:EAL domain-containing protein n=1 Tax=Imhoffiella purpurea TaxID=1249627 RepID=W9V4B2_9GAMM|nr:EAL domain-containing protein [Imhoffiella purpurea]EXJ14328.1 hypothetical protein D779_2729 [Imhoffiella purpurea]